MLPYDVVLSCVSSVTGRASQTNIDQPLQRGSNGKHAFCTPAFDVGHILEFQSMVTRRSGQINAFSQLLRGLRSLAKVVRGVLKKRATRLFNRIAGLPITVRALRKMHETPGARLRQAYARRFWKLSRPSELVEIGLALAVWPFALLALACWCLCRNGSLVAARAQLPLHRQFLDQMRLYFAAGVLPPWYYIYELYDRPRNRDARGFIYRWESKTGVLALLKELSPPFSIVSDKVSFAEQCRWFGIRTIPVLAVARNGRFEWKVDPSEAARDWFVKPIGGKGGKNIERWDYVGDGRYRGVGGQVVQSAEIIARYTTESWAMPRLIQPRIVNHPGLRLLSNGALTTVRALTCLNEDGRAELIGAVMRMAVGANHVVDNLHAGGIAAGIDLETGELGPASNLGDDARLGWIDRHPDSGAIISGFRLPCWEQLGPFAEHAHGGFSDRVLIGWDIAMTVDGPILVEANGAPDLDIMQRPFRRGLMKGRLAALLAHHVANRQHAA
jgi:hypothetical protein